MNTRIHDLLLTTTALVALACVPAYAGPDGANVVGGSANITGAGTGNVVINQNSNSAIINWNTFNIGAGQTTTFVQPNSSAVVLNRVVGGLGASTIDGTLSANGRVFLINRDGVLFGAGSVINTASFLASTNDIRNEDFLAGRYNFTIPGRPDASIVNRGTITAASGGFAALVAPGVRNTGTITATLGTVALASGNSFSLDFYGDHLITLAPGDAIAGEVRDIATGKTLKSLISNGRNGKLSANGGRVELTAAAARAVVNSVINNRGVIEANSIGTRNGRIVLGAATAGSKPVGAPRQIVRLGGKITASGKDPGTKGGSIVVTGEDIRLVNAQISASGFGGGGTVLIGGDWGGGHPNASLVSNASAQLESYAVPNATNVSVDARSTINASAIGSGNGGKVVLWSESQTTFAGTILAQGGAQSGNGGFVETSSHGSLSVSGTVDLSARGSAGTWLLDPANVIIDATPGPGVVTIASIKAGLATGDVTVATLTTGGGDGDIEIRGNTQLDWNAHTLTLSAYNNISVDAMLSTPTIVGTGTASLVMRADSTGTGFGSVLLGPGISNRIDFTGSSGSVAVYYNPPGGYTTPTDFTSSFYGQFTLASPSQLTAYMLVNSAADLANIENNLAGTYALGRDITGVGSFAPLGDISGGFTGTLDGFGGIGGNHIIEGMSITSAKAGGVGLFALIERSGVVRNLTFQNASISGTPGSGPQLLGILAGENDGQIINVSVAGTSTVTTPNAAAIAGGLVGINAGSIGSGDPNVINTVNVNVTIGSGGLTGNFNYAGGVAGINTGTISHVAVAANIAAGDDSFTGGVAGQNGNTGQPGGNSARIENASASGFVSGGQGNAVGGLVGYNISQIVNSSSISAVNGTGFSTNVGGLVGVNTTNANSNGVIDASFAQGPVNGSNGAAAGGFAGENAAGATISNSHASGAVTVTAPGATDQTGGGFVALNEGQITNSFATGPVSGNGGDTGLGGFAGANAGTITGSHTSASSTVTISGATLAFAGGFVGENGGSIDNSFAAGNVNVNAALAGVGGFVGFNVGPADHVYALGNVTIGGTAGFAGGFVGANAGPLNQAFSVGNVSSTSAFSGVGGFAGLNVSSLSQLYSTGAVSGAPNGYAGGLVGINFGNIDQTFAAGPVTGGKTGGLVAVNNLGTLASSIGDPQFAAIIPNVGGAVTNSYWDTNTTGQKSSDGGSGLTTAQLVQGLPQGFSPATWTQLPDPSYPYFPWQPNDLIPNVTIAAAAGGQDFNPAPQPQVINNLTSNVVLAALAPGNVVTILPPPLPPAAAPPSQNVRPDQPVAEPRLIALPPLNETRFVTDEVVLQIPCDTPRDRLDTVASQVGISVVSSQCLGTSGKAVYRMHLDRQGLTVANAIRALGRFQIIAVAQPNYKYETIPMNLAAASSTRSDDDQQYILKKLQLNDVHRQFTGANVPVAVIDSQIDVNHPDLQGVIAESYDAVGGAAEKPHPHGTGMAGAIGSHVRLVGTAPRARIFAVHAFSTGAGATAESTTYSIIKGLDWATSKKVRVINMSFAGPKDPSLERAIKLAADKGIILIAAAGNAGPKSPPLYPGADPNVIAITATDENDKLFTGANRGKYIAVAAPGVDIIVPGPEGTYQLTTGTSVASAEVSGIVALLLERNPNLTSADIRRILTGSAKRLGTAPRDDDFGSGLVDPEKAIENADPRLNGRPSVRR